ncbi:hypothetical protein TCAL_06558 [Tigriopus californicus]|uniref:Centromere protein S n=1 Tax=Tigriopus californicus TaxID=6832 RepID=A0A553PQI5_TIGCA|nr:centromere protein S-like [Tigriopus californicus]TRY79940.1 hypothetical protein TCAL_06558 [Tigriopus californicus]|eukprot:TCALIF_06558-PA protein Name:"Similar to apitd1 Centromere protein S (Xenopus laevis)" AED:0.02 eAED:0.02 QI:0/1/0.87/1/0.57/0.62/8/3468/139
MAQRVVETDVGEEGRLVKNQRLLASIHFACGQLATEHGQSTDLQYSRGVVAALGQLAFDHLRQCGQDLEAFARHAKRNTVQADDVKLLVRRNPHLHEHISQLAGSSGANSTKTSKRKKPAGSDSGPAKKKRDQPEPFIV